MRFDGVLCFMRKLDLKGKVFNGVTVLNEVESHRSKKESYWLCRCYCGKEFTIRGVSISKGKTKSCGCLFLNCRKIHGEYKTRFYKIWSGMKLRCSNPIAAHYDRYGGRGISVCERWQDYLNFKQDMFATYLPTLTLDRIDSNKNYEPENCKWSTRKQQSRNTARNVFIQTPNGKLTLSEIAEISGLHRGIIRYRITKYPHMDYEDLISSKRIRRHYK